MMTEGGLTPGGVAASVFRLQGVADILIVSGLLAKAKEIALAQGDVAVDCAELDALDASVVQLLLALKRRVERDGRSLRLEGMSERLVASLSPLGVMRAFADPPAAGPDGSAFADSGPEDRANADAVVAVEECADGVQSTTATESALVDETARADDSALPDAAAPEAGDVPRPPSPVLSGGVKPLAAHEAEDPANIDEHVGRLA